MKKSLTPIVAIFALLIISNFDNSQNKKQNKKYVHEKGFWVLESNIHQKINSVFRFYDDSANLIYEETVIG